MRAHHHRRGRNSGNSLIEIDVIACDNLGMFWKGGFNRRDLFRRGSLMALAGSVRKMAAAPLEFGANMCRSTFAKHHAELDEGDLTGTVPECVPEPLSDPGPGIVVRVHSTVDGDKISGVVNMGEYGETTWSADRHK